MSRTIRATLVRWLYAPPLAGQPAFLCVIAAVGLPTIVRLAVEGVVTGCEFTPYLPFVFVSAILLRWWVAGTVALIAVGIMGGAFGGVPAHGWLCFRDSALIFLACSAMMIGVAVVVRAAVAALQKRGSDETAGGVIFSLEKGQVWASWYGQSSPMLLGSQRRVTEMMEDFLKQEDLAKRLISK
jgi:hypothetical protein